MTIMSASRGQGEGGLLECRTRQGGGECGGAGSRAPYAEEGQDRAEHARWSIRHKHGCMCFFYLQIINKISQE